jgi:TPP-dependent pyruvate/acetoin dehydrogenase alpha subunit
MAGDPDQRTVLELHRAMVLSRTIELFCTEQSGHWYPAIGEEAAVVGTFAGLRADDAAAPHYRGALIVPWLRGAPLRSVLGAVVHRRSSPTLGRLYGGFAGDIARGVVPYVTMVLGPNLAVAAGLALAMKTRGSDTVAVASFGDGTAGTGDFHESLNLASVLQVPVVFVCQNNQVSISTPASEGLACDSVTEWASRYRMPAATVDGNDVLAVYCAVGDAVERGRAGHGPSFIEALTYRRTGHFWADQAAYRPPEDVEVWTQRDPITQLETRLLAGGAASRHDLDGVWDWARREVKEAAAALDEEPPLSTDDLGLEEVYEYAR